MTTATKDGEKPELDRTEGADAADKLDEGEGEEEEENETLRRFVERYHDSITQKVRETYTPKFHPESSPKKALPDLRRAPIGKQGQTIQGTALSLETARGTTIVGEMGTGKTYLAIVSARTAGFRRVMVMCPTHLVEKWKREVELTLTPEEGRAVIVHSITELRKAEREFPKKTKTGPTLFVIMSKQIAKLTYDWANTPQTKLPAEDGELYRSGEAQLPPLKYGGGNPLRRTDGSLDIMEAHKRIQRFPVCPDCHQRVTDAAGNPRHEDEVRGSRKKATCQHCKAPIWTAKRRTPTSKPKVALATYIAKKMKRYFDLFVADEVHEYKEKNSAQGMAAGGMAQMCGKSLVLTGTLMGGYSSTLFYMLYRFTPEFRDTFQYKDKGEWIKRYGFYQETTKWEEGEHIEAHGRSSRRKIGHSSAPKEIPGLLPGALFHIIDNSAFLRLSDVSTELPPYEEKIASIRMDEDPDDSGWSQKTAYAHLYQELQKEIINNLRKEGRRLLGTYLQTLLSFPDACMKGDRVIDPVTKTVLADIPPLDPDRAYPKEKALLKLVQGEKAKGRRVMVYVSHTASRDITGRVAGVLEHEGIRTAVLKTKSSKSSKTSGETGKPERPETPEHHRMGRPEPEQREKWLADQVVQGIDAVVCNPKLVQTGLDLIDFPTIIWYETEYSVYTMRQASRRSWRIGQNRPVSVYHLTYEDCLQATALQLIAKKTAASLAVEGELPEEGLSAYGQDTENLYMTLAKQIAGQLPTEEEDLEELFRRARDRELEDDRELTTDGRDEWELPAPNPTATPDPLAAPEGATADGRTPGGEDEDAERLIMAPGKRGQRGQLAMFSMEEFIRPKGSGKR